MMFVSDSCGDEIQLELGWDLSICVIMKIQKCFRMNVFRRYPIILEEKL